MIVKSADGSSGANVPPEPGRTRASLLPGAVILGLAGLAVAVLFWAMIPFWPGAGSFPTKGFVLWMTGLFVVGFIPRIMRRRVFWREGISFHQALSFEAIFQGGTLLCPQLPYPSVEQEFLARETRLPMKRILPWFRIRPTSALAIPLLLGALIAVLASRLLPALLFVGLAGAAIADGARYARAEGTALPRFLTALAFGIGAAVLEGVAFTAAGQLVSPTSPAWQLLLLYTLVLIGFELSPLPSAIGVLEVVYAGLFLLPAFVLPGLVLPFAYRLSRALPVLLLMLFYLPRYKLSLSDLFDRRLPVALAMSRRPREGWPEEGVLDRPRLSVVIPAYNEEARLPAFLPKVAAFAASFPGRAEVIVVDDGSRDGTASYVESVAAGESTVRLVRQETNQGKGAAVRRGVLESIGKYVLFADADGATPIGEVEKLLPLADAGIEIVIASRKAGGDVERSLLRSLMGATFYRLTNLLAVPGVADTQCGFKLFHHRAAHRVFPLVVERGWAFDVEVLFLAQKLGFAIAEVPVDWRAIEGSKMHPVKDAVRMFLALLRIRRRSAGLVSSILDRRPS